MQRWNHGVCQVSMKRFLLAIFLFAGISACKKQLTDTSDLIGDYKGVFTRSAAAIDYFPAQITLSLKQGTFSGTSNVQNYPAICNGNWKIENSHLKFSNTCSFTANFDWTFILDGEFQFERSGKTLKIWRSYGNGQSDSYLLEKN